MKRALLFFVVLGLLLVVGCGSYNPEKPLNVTWFEISGPNDEMKCWIAKVGQGITTWGEGIYCLTEEQP